MAGRGAEGRTVHRGKDTAKRRKFLSPPPGSICFEIEEDEFDCGFLDEAVAASARRVVTAALFLGRVPAVWIGVGPVVAVLPSRKQRRFTTDDPWEDYDLGGEEERDASFLGVGLGGAPPAEE